MVRCCAAQSSGGRVCRKVKFQGTGIFNINNGVNVCWSKKKNMLDLLLNLIPVEILYSLFHNNDR